MKLYYAPGACSLAPHIVAREAGLEIELVKVDIPNRKTEHGKDFLTINPKGYVPALTLDNGEVLTEAGVVCQYLADLKPDSGLASPFGSLQRYHEMSAINFVATEMHKQIGALFNPALTPDMQATQKSVIARRLKSLESMLDGKPFMRGENFTVADAYLFTTLNWTRLHHIALDDYPNIKAFMQRVGERDKVRQAMLAEGLVK